MGTKGQHLLSNDTNAEIPKTLLPEDNTSVFGSCIKMKEQLINVVSSNSVLYNCLHKLHMDKARNLKRDV